MPDYGQELRFGAFLTPGNADPDEVLGLARLCESVGLDLVTFQDHPYQPRFLDTWTLMSAVAAITERIRIAPNVINLPLRPPAVLARSAASLDLISHGRFELALGAGSFWDAIEAMGGPRRSPGEAYQAFAEALRVIRTLWDTDTKGVARVDGEHYRVSGAKRGPAPAHRMEIWVGATGPRMLRLIGRECDGWLPSLSHVGREGDGPVRTRAQRGPEAARSRAMNTAALGDLNATIDGAARAAGRDPAAIRRLLNVGALTPRGSSGGTTDGDSSQRVDMLTDLALRTGVSTFIRAGDDADGIRRFAGEIAPAVRSAVTAARAGKRSSG